MTLKVAINGFGRIGRNVLRAIVESGRRARAAARESENHATGRRQDK